MSYRVLLACGVLCCAFAAFAGCGAPPLRPLGRDLQLPSSPPPLQACPALAINGPALILPAPGSTGILTTITLLTFAPIAGTGQSIAGTATLHGSDGSTIVSGQLTPSVDRTSTVATIAGLAPHTTYAVHVSGALLGGGCSIPFAADDGSFATL